MVCLDSPCLQVARTAEAVSSSFSGMISKALLKVGSFQCSDGSENLLTVARCCRSVASCVYVPLLSLKTFISAEGLMWMTFCW